MTYDNRIVLVGFMSEWCGACHAQNPILDELGKIIGNTAEIIKVDVNEHRDIVREWNVDATPTLFILKNDNIFKKFIGLTDRNILEYAINNALYIV
jgi:thioredoxin 1